MDYKYISEKTGIAISTLYKWEKTRPEALKALINGVKFDNIEKETKKNMIEEITNELEKLPENKVKKIYHIIKAEIIDIEEQLKRG